MSEHDLETDPSETEVDEADESELPGGLPADFSTFILSLNAAALLHMGEAQLPEGEPTPPKNLMLAKQTIDLLAMLETKTQGNLSGAEEKLLSKMLYDLRIRFVRAR